MKFILLTSLLVSGLAFAYHSGTHTNHPVKEDAVQNDKREPASDEKKLTKPEAQKVAPKE